MEKATQQLVVKHNYLINAKYDFSLLEMKVFLLAVSKIQPQDKTTTKYRIYVKDFKQLVNTQSKQEYKRVKATVKSLMKKIVEIPRGEDKSVLMCQLF